MIETIQNVFERAAAWFEAHEGARAFCLAVVFGILFTQAVKYRLPACWDKTRVKRASHLVAILSAGGMALWLWPGKATLALPYALLAGMACPPTYTTLKWALPNLLRRWGWDCVQERKLEKGADGQ